MHMHVWANTSIHTYLPVCAFVYVHVPIYIALKNRRMMKDVGCKQQWFCGAMRQLITCSLKSLGQYLKCSPVFG